MKGLTMKRQSRQNQRRVIASILTGMFLAQQSMGLSVLAASTITGFTSGGSGTFNINPEGKIGNDIGYRQYEQFILGKFLHVGKFDRKLALGIRIRDIKKRHLTGKILLPVLNDAVHVNSIHIHQLPAVSGKAVECPGLYEPFDHTLVDFLAVHPFKKIVYIAKITMRFTLVYY